MSTRSRFGRGARFVFAALLAALCVTAAGCPEKARGRLGDPCGEDSECASGLCLEGVCLDPLGDEDGDGLLNGREGELGTNPLAADTDGDGEPDGDEVPNNDALDADLDGFIDATESNRPEADEDKDCLPDEVDPQNTVFDEDSERLVLRWCLIEGVCGADIASLVALCDRDLAGDPDAVTCDYSNVGNFEPVEQSCDLLDNDCSGEVDEGLEDVAGTESICPRTGVCATAAGTPRATCTDGEWVCSFEGVPGHEPGAETSCDGLDNDCNGETDEDFTYGEGGLTLGVGDSCGTGACAGGVVVCAPEGDALVCSSGGTGGEVCDGADNDCDGQTDEGFALDGVTVGGACTGTGVCASERGQVECLDAATAVCSVNEGGSEWAGEPEICDGADNDCDGDTDVDPVADPGVCPPFGVCSGAAAVVCDAQGAPECDLSGVTGYEEAEATCDGADNDCDGTVDEGLPLVFAGAAENVALGVPEDRLDYAAAAAPDQGVLLLAGGAAPSWNPFLPGSTTSVDTWEMALGDGEWIPKAVQGDAAKPPARAGGWMVYDAARGRMLLGGGVPPLGGGAGREDLWAFDLAALTWASVATSGVPNVTRGAALVVGEELWLLSGERYPAAKATGIDGAWAYRAPLSDPAALAAVELALPLRSGPAAAYDEANDRIAVFGGADEAASDEAFIVFLGGPQPVVEEFFLDPAGVSPPPQAGGLLMADPTGGGDFFFLGYRAATDGAQSTWQLSELLPGQWRWAPLAQNANDQPPRRTGAVAAATDDRVRVWLGVGPDGLLRRDAWSFDPTVPRWSRIPEVDERFPAPRRLAAAALDPDALIWHVYGGATQSVAGYGVRTDFWAYDLRAGSWSKVAQTGAARPAVMGPATVWDAAGDRLFLFGGAHVAGDGSVDLETGVDELWTWDAASGAWSQTTLSAGGGPGPLVGHTAVVTPDGAAALVYGGFVDGEPTAGLWRYTFATGAWSALTPAAAPNPRAGHLAIMDAGRGLMFAFGGEGAAGAVGVYDVAAGTWNERATTLGASITIAFGGYDPVSQEAAIVGVSLVTGVPAWSRVLLGDPAAPQVQTWVGASQMPPALFFAPVVYDAAQRGLLALAGTDVPDRLPHGLWRLPQECP